MSRGRRPSICYVVPGMDLVPGSASTRQTLGLARALAAHADVTVAFRRVTGPMSHDSLDIVALEPNCLADVWRDIERVAAGLGAPERGAALVASLQARMAAIAEAVRGRPRPRVATIEWCAPLLAGGNWMPELVERAGGENLFGVAGGHSPLSWDALRAADPDVILVAPCGYDLARTRDDVAILEALPGWRELRARVALADGNAFFNRPGPRLVESLEILSDVIHGTDHGHRGVGWSWLGEGE